MAALYADIQQNQPDFATDGEDLGVIRRLVFIDMVFGDTCGLLRIFFWIDENSYQGLGKTLTSGGNPVSDQSTSYFTGYQTADGLTVYSAGQYNGQDYITYMIFNSYSPQMPAVSGIWYAIITSPGALGPVGMIGAQGTVTMTATN